MDVQVNYLAVFLAATSSMVVGSIWYSKSAFYERWARLAKVKPIPGFKGSDMAVLLGMTFVASLVTAYILAHVSFLSNDFFRNNFLQDALTTAFWLWLGLTAARVFTHDLFENRPRQLTLLTVSNELVTLLVMALIIGAMGHPGV